MVSAQAPGKLRFYRRTPDNALVFIYGNAVAATGPSGSSDGSIASTPDTWLSLPPQLGNKVCQVNDNLVVTYEAAAGVTIDASDCEFSIPITYSDGSVDSLGGPDSSTDWDVQQAGDTAFVAGSETILCAKTVRKPFAFGGGKLFASVEDNS